MSASVNSPKLDTFGGYVDSYNFNVNKKWMVPGVVPFLNTLSGAVRLVGNVALGVFNLLKAIAYSAVGAGQMLFGKNPTYFRHAEDSINGLAVNAVFCALAIFEMVPFIGNVPYILMHCFLKINDR